MTGFASVRSRDWTRPFGIARPDCPPDDDVTELAAWLAGRFDSLAADTFELGHGHSEATG